MTETGESNDLGIDGLGSGVRIGQGGSAVVYRARQDELDRDVAVKVLGGVVDEDTRRRFDRERRLMGRLSQHEGMVTVYQTGFTSRNEPFIVMPLLGSSLDDEIKQRPVPWRRAVEIMADVCRTVGFAHDQEIVHRDLKPANIMMSTSGRPLVADFGIARIVDTKTNLEATALTLTPAYSPPEALETTVADPSTDVYSLGATLYALIAGHPPYCPPGQDRTLMILMRSIVDDPVPQLGELAPPEVQAVLDRSMAKLPENRYGAVVEMAEALESAAAAAGERTDGDTVIVTNGVDRAGGEDRKGASTRRRAIVAVAVVAALLVVVAGILATQSGGDDNEAAPASSAADEGASLVDEGVAPDAANVGDGSLPAVLDPVATEVATTDAVLVVEGGEVFLLPFDEPGPDTFTGSVAAALTDELVVFVESGGVDPSPAEPTVDAGGSDEPSTAVTGVAGTTDGVFAGTEGIAACAPDQLIDGLDPTSPETVAWAAIQEIDVPSIPTFIGGLTATVLTADTRITDHRFVDGEAVPSQAVLQVGTSVMIDAFGEPQVRCSSGSPLGPPEAVDGTTRYVGTAWPTFEPARTVAVVASPEPVEEFVLSDIAGGPDFIRPVGSSGASDRPLLPGEVLAVGAVTAIPDGGLETLTTNEITLTFRPLGGDVTGTLGWTIALEGITIVVDGQLVGTYDPATGTMSGTGTGTTSAGGTFFGEGGAEWSATVDPAAGTISGSLGEGLLFELLFPPYGV